MADTQATKADVVRGFQGRQTLMAPIVLGDMTLASPTTQTTIGANGAASALTANPVGYITIMVGNAPFVIPYYNP